MKRQTPYTTAAMFALFGFAHIQAEDIPDGILPQNKRQVVGTGVTTTSMSSTDTPSTTTEPATSPTRDTAPTSEPPPDTTQEATPTSAESSEQTSESSPRQTSTVPTSIDVTTTNSDGSTVTSRIATSTAVGDDTNTSDVVDAGSTTINRSTLSSATVITSALVASTTIPETYTSFWTTTGQVLSSLVTSYRVVVSTTGFATSTIEPSLQGGGSSGSGLSQNSKNIIGGVVGGVGGAIVVGAIAIVAWRLWGKKKQQAVPQDDWRTATPQSGSLTKEGRESTGLDRYNNPGGSLNTASNF